MNDENKIDFCCRCYSVHGRTSKAYILYSCEKSRFGSRTADLYKKSFNFNEVEQSVLIL